MLWAARIKPNQRLFKAVVGHFAAWRGSGNEGHLLDGLATKIRPHAWKSDLAHELIRRQANDGSWSNKNARWWEDNKDLVTGYSLLALANCR